MIRRIIMDINDIFNEFGMQTLNDALQSLENYSLMPTGVPHLDVMYGGFKSPGLNLLFGPRETCKSTICLIIAANYLEIIPTGLVIYADFEGNATDPQRAANIIGDNNRFVFLSLRVAESAEEAFGRLNQALVKIQNKYPQLPILLIIDSIGAMVTSGELKGNDAIAKVARVVTTEVKKLMSLLLKPRSMIVAINQHRENISMYGKNYYLVGGHALQHLSSRQIRLSAKKTRERDEIIYDVTFHNEKSRPPEFIDKMVMVLRNTITGEVSIQNAGRAILSGLIRLGKVSQNGPFYQMGDTKYRGADKFCEEVINVHLQDYYQQILSDYDKMLEGRLIKDTSGDLIIPQLKFIGD